MITPRQAFLTLEYDGTDISSDIRKDVENFTSSRCGTVLIFWDSIAT